MQNEISSLSNALKTAEETIESCQTGALKIDEDLKSHREDLDEIASIIKSNSVQEKRINCEIDNLVLKERELSDFLSKTKLHLRTNEEHQKKYIELVENEKSRTKIIFQSDGYKNQEKAIKKLSNDIEINKKKLQVFERGESKIIKERIDRTTLKGD